MRRIGMEERDNPVKDFFFLLAHVTRLSPEELEISSINLDDYGI